MFATSFHLVLNLIKLLQKGSCELNLIFYYQLPLVTWHQNKYCKLINLIKTLPVDRATRKSRGRRWWGWWRPSGSWRSRWSRSRSSSGPGSRLQIWGREIRETLEELKSFPVNAKLLFRLLEHWQRFLFIQTAWNVSIQLLIQVNLLR